MSLPLSAPYKWAKDLYSEQHFRKFNIDYEMRDVPLSDIDWERSKANHARRGAPVESIHVADLVTAIKHGDQLPAPCVLDVGSKSKLRYVVLSGNHRLPASRDAGHTSALCYVVQSEDEKVIGGLVLSLNPPTRAISRTDRIVSALEQIDRHGLTVKEASRMTCISVEALHVAIRVEEMKKKLEGFGLKTKGLLATHLDALGRIQNMNVLIQAAKLAIEAKLGGDEISALAKGIKESGTELSQLGVVSAFAKQCGIRPGIDVGVNVPLPVSTLQRSAREFKRTLTTFERILHASRNLQQVGFTDKYVKEQIKERCFKFNKRLTSFLQHSN